MPVAFPNIAPSGRTYSPGKFPQSEFRAQNGALTVVRFGNKRVDAELALSFDNISDENAALILANYEQVNSAWDYVTFTADNAAKGASDAMRTYIKETGSSALRWRYAEPPSVQSTFRGRSTVSCKFVAVLDG